MRVRSQKMWRSQRGAALVIALFTLMLISVLGTALILMAGTQAAIKGNYKSSMHAFYDAKAGLEEARGRLWSFNPNNIGSCVFPSTGPPMPVDRVCYIVNPSAGETVDPTNLDPSNPYADFEYQQEFQQPVTAAAGLQPVIPSTSPLGGGIAGPLYKWVRITPRTEASGNIDVDGSGGPPYNANPLYYDGTQQGTLPFFQSAGNPAPSQVLTITALSVTPYGSRRMAQYTVAQASAATSNLNLDVAPLMLLGDNPVYTPARSRSFQVNGNDRSGAYSGACALPPQSATTALGLTDDPTNIISAISTLRRQNNYQTSGAPSPSVSNVYSALPPGELSPQTLDSLVQSLTASATIVINGPATSLPSYGSPSQPILAVVLPSGSNVRDGDLTLTNVIGYGILVVTGDLNLSGTFGWRGLILVIGEGKINGNSVNGNEIDGAMIAAQTRDSSYHLLSSLGSVNVNWSNGKGGVFYDSCWINNAMGAFPYKVLSFREIPQLQ
jgi:hypothetical protein